MREERKTKNERRKKKLFRSLSTQKKNSQADFRDKVVVDVGAGSGILSLFAAQAGAERVYAVEASEMAEHAERLCAANASSGGDRVTVVRSRVESAPLPRHCADVLVSEPMGTLLLNERMLESYVFARDTLLKPGGRMFPVSEFLAFFLKARSRVTKRRSNPDLFNFSNLSKTLQALGRIHVAAFSDPQLHAEMASKASFGAAGLLRRRPLEPRGARGLGLLQAGRRRRRRPGMPRERRRDARRRLRERDSRGADPRGGPAEAGDGDCGRMRGARGRGVV